MLHRYITIESLCNSIFDISINKICFMLLKGNLNITAKASYAMNDFFLKMKYIEIVRLVI